MTDDGETQDLAARAPTPRDRLLVMWDDRSASATVPDRGGIVIGRDPSADLVIEHPSVSRRHARVDVSGGLGITDLDSANGTRVGGRRLAKGERAALGAGLVVEIGVAVLVVQRRSAAAVAPPVGTATREQHPLGIFVPADGPMAQVHRLVEHVAASNLSVLVLGESGTGKEIAAEAIHRFSKRAKGPFVRLNCASLPESLLESELFGHEKGAFTGAVAAKPGLIEGADGGTLFLDELGEMPLATQAKLLRVLESREVTRLGSLAPRKVDFRLVAATNRDLDAEIAKGTFRLDLYHRVDGVSIALPPLRARKTEILPLARLFATRASAAEGRSVPTLSPEAGRALEAHAWPGNVRELKNVMERAVVLAMDGVVTPEHLHLRAPGPPPAPASASASALASASTHASAPALAHASAPAPALASAPALAPAPDDERQRILAALERCGGNQSRAAAELGIPRRTLLRRLDEYGVPRPRK
ncbi:MAG: sigma 54-interacting transcriptional regulator [Myxococcales bacterium]|nr:sigma 54-interacting transcriptional regulator [Myxococcales bacterium]